MNEELIRQCARDGAAVEHGSRGFDGIAKDFLAGENDETVIVGSAMHAIRLYHARAVAPLRQENAELRALVAELTEQTKRDGERIGHLEAKVAPLVEAAKDVVECLDREKNFLAVDFLRDALAPFQRDGQEMKPGTNFRPNTDAPKDGSLFRLWYIGEGERVCSTVFRWHAGAELFVETPAPKNVPPFELDSVNDLEALGWEPVEEKEEARDA